MPRKQKSHNFRLISQKGLTKIVLLALCLTSFILILNLVVCLVFPANYPTSNLNEVKSLRSIYVSGLPDEYKNVLISSVQFVPAPINTKLVHEVDIHSLDEASFHDVIEYRLTENATVWLSDGLFLEYEGVRDLQAEVDGEKINLKLTEHEGKTYYVVPELNLSKIDGVVTFAASFRYNILDKSTSNVKVPLIFNSNYAQYVNLPLIIIQVQQGSESDVCEFRVTFDVPFRRIINDQSGWQDAFVPLDSLKTVDQNTSSYSFRFFQYPINQTIRKNGDIYSFETHFSQNNVSNTPSVTIVPILAIPILLGFLLASPIYTPLLFRLKKVVEIKGENTDKKTQFVILGLLIVTIGSYLIPFLASFLLPFWGVPLDKVIPLICYTAEIVNPVVLILIFMYPLVFAVSFHFWKKKK